MKTVKVVVLTSFVLIVVAVSVFLSQRGDPAVTPAETPIVEPSPATQPAPTDSSSTQTQTQLPSSPTTAATPSFVTVHQPAPQTGAATPNTNLPVELPPNAVVTVNDAPITKNQLDEELNRLLISPNTHGGINPEKKEDLRKLALDELIARELAYQEAKIMGLTASEKEINASFNRIRKRYRTANDFGEALRAEKITEKDLKQRIERDLLLKKINQLEIENRARVSEAEAQQHYDANKAKFVAPASVRLWNIFVKIETGRENEARAKIEKIYKLLREGAEFDAMAYKYSEDDYRIMGGDFGWVHRGQLAPELERIIFSAKENEITGPFQTGSGWYIVKISGSRPEQQLTYQEVKEKIKTGLYKQRLRQARIDFVNRLKAAATIKYANGNE